MEKVSPFDVLAASGESDDKVTVIKKNTGTQITRTLKVLVSCSDIFDFEAADELQPVCNQCANFVQTKTFPFALLEFLL